MVLEDYGIIKTTIFPYLPPAIQGLLNGVDAAFFSELEEIRLRLFKPLLLRRGEKEYTLRLQGGISEDFKDAYIVGEEDMYRCLSSISDNSLYAFAEEIKKGFITIPGGHRVGLAGQVIANQHEVINIKNFSGIAFRIAREKIGCAVPILNYIYKADKSLNNLLIISPPRCGKTTLLRDITRLISNGNSHASGSNVSIIDERSELAGCYNGAAQLDTGPRTDILDGCPKALGMIMAIRSLSPSVLVTDEIGGQDDILAIEECIRAGVAVITSVHAGNIAELLDKPGWRKLLAAKTFDYFVIMSRNQGPGTIEKIVRWDKAWFT